MAKITVAVAQTCSQQGNLERTLDKLEELVRKAAASGARFCVFPEAFIGGYPKFSTFGAEVGVRAPAGRDEFLNYFNSAIIIPSPAIDRISRLAIELQVSLVIGVIEREQHGATLYCTAIYVDSVAGYVAKHRKLMPTGTERLIWGFGDSTTIKAQTMSISNNQSEVEKVVCSATICWENYMPLLRYHYYSQGTQLYCAPTVDARDSWIPSMQHIATESRCFVLSACQFARVSDYAEQHFAQDIEKRDPNEIVIAGGSCIVDPMGQILAGPMRETDGVLTAEIDLDDIIRGKFDMDSCGHYSRSDIFKLQVT